ncbi:hypothetical protein ACFL2E_04585 [Thermodesulfobacteriota bacterium]
MKNNLSKWAYQGLHGCAKIPTGLFCKRIVFVVLIAGLFVIWSTDGSADGNQVKKRDADKDGIIDQVAEFDHQGRLVSLAVDNNHDGVMDTFQYYVHGEIVRLEKNMDTKPGIDMRTYFKNGRKIRQERLDVQGNIYQEMDLDAAGKPFEIREDTNVDQKIDTVYHIEKGQITYITRDPDGDGVTNVFELYQNGALVERRNDENGDDTVEERLLFNEDGSLARRHLDTDQNGDLDMLEIYRNGLIQLQQWDQDQDQRYEKIAIFEKGDILRIEEDSDMDGRMDTFQRYQDNRLVFVEKDTNGDGEIDTKIWYDIGRQKNTLRDLDHDGRFEMTHWYDRPPWTRVTELDSDGSGNVDVRSYFMHDILRRRESLEKNGDLVELRENFDEKGLLINSLEDSNADGRWDMTWYFDVRGMFQRAEKDSDADNRVDTWYYYESGRLSEVSEDTNGDGRPDVWEDYDTSETMTQRKKDLDFDGVADINE